MIAYRISAIRDRSLKIIRVPFVVVMLLVVALGQNPQLHTTAGSRFPTVIFTSVLWTAEPSYYSIAIDSTGTATYQSAPDSIGKTGVPYTIEFQVTDRTRRITFNVARQLDYFGEKTQASLSSPQSNSVRTLAYHDSRLRNQITYSSSSDSEIEELTSVFEDISRTLEFGRRLTYFREQDHNRLASELERLQAEGTRHSLRELQAIAPVLKGIAADERVDQASRQRAEDLLNPSAHPYGDRASH